MTVARTTGFSGETTEQDELLSWSRVRRLLLYSAIGFLIILTNFPTFLIRTIDINVSDPGLRAGLEAPIHVTQALMAALIGAHPTQFFERAMTCAFVLLWLFLGLLVIFSALRRSLIMLACGLGGATVGYVTVHLLAWAAIALALAIGGALFVTRWAAIALAVFAAFLSHHMIATLIVVAVAGGLVAIAFFKSRFLEILLRLGIFLTVAAGVIWVLSIVLPALYRWIILPILNFLRSLLGPLIHFLFIVAKAVALVVGALLLIIAAIAAILVSTALLGSLLISQIQAGWHAARSSKLMLVAGFAIGSALSLIVLTSVATPAVAGSLNAAWFHSIALAFPTRQPTSVVTDSFLFALPGSVKDFVMAYLTNMQAPALDSLVFMAIVALTFLSMVLRIFGLEPAEEQDVTIGFVLEEYVKMAGGLFVGLVIIALLPFSANSQS